MKRFLKAIATFSLIEAIGRQPALAGGMMLFGLGGALVASGAFNTPASVPETSSIFGTTQGWGVSNSALVPNGGTSGPFAFPSSNTGGFVIYAEALVDANLGFSEFALGGNTQGLSLRNGAFQEVRFWNGDSSREWFLGTSLEGSASSAGGTGYADGYYPFTATGGGCAREPTGVWSQGVTGGSNPNAAIIDPGFMCSTTPTIDTASIPTDGAQVPTGLAASLAATSCAVVSVGGVNQAQVTAHVKVAHGVTPGLTYTMQGFTGSGFTGYNGTYTAISGTAGTTLVGTTGATSCPTTPLDTSGHEGTALSGTGGTIALPGVAGGNTGVATHAGQHVCVAFGEYGSDSNFPGAQFFTAVDDQGNSLVGSPALIPWLNQGTANFTGRINITTPETFTGASWAATGSGQATFTTSATTTLSVGDQFTVTNAITGYNGTYTALTGTTGTTVVGALVGGATLANPTMFVLGHVGASGGGSSAGASFFTDIVQGGGTVRVGDTIAASDFPAGPITIASGTSSPYTVAGTGVPFLSAEEFITESNAAGVTSTGTITPIAMIVTAMKPYVISAATYSGGQVTFTTATNPGFVPGSEFTASGLTSTTGNVNLTYVAVAGTGTTTVVGSPLTGPLGTPSTLANPGTISLASSPQLVSVIMPDMAVLPASAGSLISAFGTSGTTGQGGVGSYVLTQPQTSPVGSVGSPVTIFTYTSYYYTASSSGNPSGGTVTANPQSAVSDFVTAIGGQTTSPTTIGGSWGGALGNVAMLYGATPQPSTADMASLCKKQTTLTSYATAHSLTVHSLYALNDPGIWGDSSLWAGKAFISAASGSTATFNVSSTQHGSTPTTGTIAGPGVPGCPQACPTLSGSTLTWGSAIAANVGSSGSPVAMTAGAFKPAVPIATNSVNGYIDSPSGVPTLHVTSVGTGSGFAQFTGSLVTAFGAQIDNGSGGSGNTLTVTSPGDQFDTTPGLIGVGTVVSVPGGSPSTVTVTALGTGRGFAGTYTVDGAAQLVSPEGMFGGGVLPGFPTFLDATGLIGSLAIGSVVTDGGVHITGAPVLINNNPSGAFWPINGSYYGAIAPETMYATGTTLTPGQYLANSSISTPTKIIKYGTLSACATTGSPVCGTYILSACPNAACAVGSDPAIGGTPVAITTTSVSDGGAIAPGPALTIRDLGPGVTFPVNTSTGNGTISISGTYDASTLGGTPTTIQAQISNTANGPPIAGCSACAWTNLSSPTLSGGNWSGQVVNIPSTDGPLYVSVCAGNGTPACSTNNGTAYATLPNFVKIGFILDLETNGIGGGLAGGQGGYAINYYTGLWGVNRFAGSQAEYTTGPPLLPNLGSSVPSSYAPTTSIMIAGDRFGINGGANPFLSEGIGALGQNITTAFGWPFTLDNWARDGTGIEPTALGNIQQNQTIALADGTKTAWCSSAKFCANASVSGPLFYNAAALTGATMNGATITSGGVLDFAATPSPSPSPTGVGLWQGALEPGMVITGAGIPGGTTLSYCVTGCTSAAYPASGGGLSAQEWQTTYSGTAITAETITASLPAGAVPGGLESPVSGYSLQQAQGVPFVPGGQAFSFQMMQAGTFKVSVNGSVVCRDTQTFQYNTPGGNCTGAGISSSFVNYQTGDYSVTFSSPPAANAIINATWTEIISPESVIDKSTPLAASQGRPTGIDFMGQGTDQSGTISSLFAKTPGGVNGHIMFGCATNGDILNNGRLGYEFLSPGYTKFVSYVYNTRFPATIPDVSANTIFLSANESRTEGAIFAGPNPNGDQLTCNAWSVDVVNPSAFTGTIASNVLTLSAPATGQMWEGEVIGGAGQPGMFIQSLASGAWGASGSTYNVSGMPSGFTFTGPMNNAAYYIGSAPKIYIGNMPDIAMQQIQGLDTTTLLSPHLAGGFAGGRRIGARWAAEIWEFLTNSLTFAAPAVDRTKASACDSSALASPCFDTGNTFAATHAVSWSASGFFQISGGIAAHARPFVVGQAVTCSPACGSGLVITSLQGPPTQSASGSGFGQVGHTFGFFAAPVGGGSLPSSSGSGTITAGCSGMPGTGSNCIDIAFKLNAPGATALDTCGANNLNGTATNYTPPNGVCSGTGIGEIIRDFRIGTRQCMLCFTAGSVYMDGADVYNNMTFNQSAAFTCNLVTAILTQCVKGPVYTNGVPTAVGIWPSGGTYIAYGETSLDVGSRIAQTMGYPGGQSFTINFPGSGYTDTTAGHPYHVTATGCALASGFFPGAPAGVAPTFDVWVSGGSIVDVYPSATLTNSAGMGIGGAAPNSPTACSIPLTSITCPGGSCGGVVPDIVQGPTEGVGGVGTYNTDSNSMGVLLYDNTGEPGGPLNSFFTNSRGGYFEPGLPVTPFGGFMGMQVSG